MVGNKTYTTPYHERTLVDRLLRPDPERFGPHIAGCIYLLRALKNVAKPNRHECNLCGYRGRLFPVGSPPRNAAACPVCHSRERHRLVGLWLSNQTQLPANSHILHFAPEPVLEKLFRLKFAMYRSADLAAGIADTILNIEDIDLADESVDLVVCSHVLEHVDDTKALREMHRILRPGGRALLMFPIIEGWDTTYENADITSDEARAQHFGQYDHVRYFGRDVRERIRRAGFRLDEYTAEEPFVSMYGLSRGEKIFIAVKHE